MIVFDTLGVTRKLKEAGIDAKQAEAIAEVARLSALRRYDVKRLGDGPANLDPQLGAVKTELVARIEKYIRQRGLTQIQAAELLGLPHQDLSRLLRGELPEYPLEWLFTLATTLGSDVDIAIGEPRTERPGRLSVAA